MLIATEYNKAKYFFVVFRCLLDPNEFYDDSHQRVTFDYQSLFVSLRACCCILIALGPHMLAPKKNFRLFAGHCKRQNFFLRVSVDTILDRFSFKKLSNSMNIFRYVRLRFRVRPPLQKSRRNHRYYVC